MKFQINMPSNISLFRPAILLILILPILFLGGCKPKTAGTYIVSVSMNYGNFRAQTIDVKDVTLTVVKTGVDKQYGRWNEHTITFDEKSPIKCNLEIELEGWRGEDEARPQDKEGMFSEVVKRQSCEMTDKDGKKYSARVIEGQIRAYKDDLTGEHSFYGTIKLMAEKTDDFGEYNVTLTGVRK